MRNFRQGMLANGVKLLETKVAVLKLEADKVEQYSLWPNLRFSGIPETGGTTTENTTEILLKVINANMCPDAPILPEQIERSHRLALNKTATAKSRQRTIIVRVGSESTRDAVYRACFMRKNGSKDFVNEDLTSIRAALAFKTRQLKKGGKI